MTSGASDAAEVQNSLTEPTDYSDRAPLGAVLETLQKLGIRIGTSFYSYHYVLRVVVASTVEKGGPWALSAKRVKEIERTSGSRR